MKVFKISLLILISLFVLVIIGGSIFINHISKKALPDYNGTIKLEGIQEEVTIYRDSFAIPHIYAKNEKDLYLAVGYVLAQDRLWQMDLLRRATQGKLSEIFGDDLINTDLLLRSLRIPEKSQLIIDSSDQVVYNAMDFFAQGVNLYIENNTDKLPVEFSILGYKPEKWLAKHSINLIGYMAWDLSSGWVAEVAVHELRKILNDQKFNQLVPNLSKQTSLMFPDFKLDKKSAKGLLSARDEFNKLEELGLNIFYGSNNWAVSGQKSTTGKPVLANDMHLGLSTPGIWVQMHQVIEGKLDVTGVVLPGQPFVISGHNNNIAWGLTNVMVDDVDFYKETLDKDSIKYKLDGKWTGLLIREELIKSKSGKEFKKYIRFTHRGPIISTFKDITNDALSMAWVGNHFSNEVQSMYYLNRASNWNEFKDAMKYFNSISQNTVYADIEGNIGLYCCAGIPIRKGNGCLVMPGDTTLYDWKGLVPFEKRPHVYNPERGYVISANNNVANENYPYHISHWFHLPARYDRIEEMITEKEKLSIDDHSRIQNDFLSPYAIKTKAELLLSLNEINNLTDKEKVALDKLKEWDGIYSKESIAPTLFEKLYFTLLKNTIIDEVGKKLYDEILKEKTFAWSLADELFNNNESTWFDDITTEDIIETFNDIIAKSFKQAIHELTEEYGEDIEGWRWADVHKLTLKHPMGKVKLLEKLFKLNSNTFDVGGSYHTVAPYSFKFGGNFEVVHGASQRHIYSIGSWNKSLSIIPTGTSGIPASPYYCDQSELYTKGEYHKDITDLNIIKQNAKYVMIISNK